MSVSKERIKKITEYNKEKYDRIIVYFPKGKKQTYKSCAWKSGISVNKFINIACETLYDDIENGNSH